MRGLVAWLVAAAAVSGCASSETLRLRADRHLELANRAASQGDSHTAIKEQQQALHYYDRATARAWEESRPPPPVPTLQPPYPDRLKP
jgi:hypothetical protein